MFLSLSDVESLKGKKGVRELSAINHLTRSRGVPFKGRTEHCMFIHTKQLTKKGNTWNIL